MSNSSNLGWETVVSSKAAKSVKAGSGKNSAANAAKKKFAEKAPKIDDFLPADKAAAVHNLNDDSGTSSVPPPAKHKSTDGSKNKKQKNNNIQTKEKKAPTEKKPRSIEDAAIAFCSNEFKSVITQTKVLYPGNFILWLRDAASYLNDALATGNNKLEVEYNLNPFSLKPYSLLTKDARQTVLQLLEDVGAKARQSCYEIFLSNFAHDLSKGLNVNGYICMLQALSEAYPVLCIGQTKRLSDLVRSFQNRHNVALAILWILGLGGRKDLPIGIKVWLLYLKPMLRLRPYNRFVVDYLCGLVFFHEKTVELSPPHIHKAPRVLYPVQFFQILDSIFVEAPSVLNKELQAELLLQYPAIKSLALGDFSVDHELFAEFLRRYDESVLSPNSSSKYKSELIHCLTQCIINNPAAVISHWQQMYRFHLSGSAKLLTHIDQNWSTLKTDPKIRSNLGSLLVLIEAFNDSNHKNPQEKEGLHDATVACKSLMKKMTLLQGTSNSWFPWKTLAFLLVIGIAAVVNHNVLKKGSFKASNMGKFLADVGMYNSTLQAYNWTVATGTAAKTWSEVNFPVYFATVCAHANTFLIKSKAVLKDLKETVWPYLVDKANEHLPGIKAKLFMFAEESWKMFEKFARLALEQSIVYSQILWGALQEASVTIKVCIHDIIDGKIDLTDVYNASLKMWNSGVLHLGQLGLYARDKINLILA